MKVTTHQLSLDGATVDPAAGQIDRGEMTAGEVEALLTRFTALDAVQNQYHDPQVLVRVRDESHLIRMSRGRLCLYDARDVSQPAQTLTLPALMARLEGRDLPATAPAATAPEPEIPDSPRPRPASRATVAVAVLIVAVGLNLWGLWQHLHRGGNPPPPEYAVITDAARIAALNRTLAGEYATGRDAGSRLMIIRPGGRVEFALLAVAPDGQLQRTRKFDDTFAWGQRRDGSYGLITAARGPVEITPTGQPRHFGDTYLRIPAGQ